MAKQNTAYPDLYKFNNEQYANNLAQQQGQAANPYHDMADNVAPGLQGSGGYGYEEGQQFNTDPSPNNFWTPGQTPAITPGPNSTVTSQQYDPNAIANNANTGIAGGQNTTAYSGPKDINAMVSYFQQSNPVTAGIDGLLKFLTSNGINATRATRAGGVPSDDKIIVNGKTYDLIKDVGGPGQSWQFIDESLGGGGGGGGTVNYGPPQSPMVLGDGSIPPGIPYTPQAAPQQNPNATNLLNDILTKPVYDQNYLNQLNETQKELALSRNQQLGDQLLQGAAGRNTTNSGQLQRRQAELGNDLTRQLLSSNRDVNLQTQGANRQGFLDALTHASQMFGNDLAGAQFGADEGLRATQQRRADQELARLIEQFNRDNTYRYDAINNNNQQQLINLLLGTR